MDENKKELTDRLTGYISRAVAFRKVNKDDEYLKNMAYYETLQWSLADLKDEKPFLVKSDINHIKNAVDLRLASLYASDYIGDLVPLSAEDSPKLEKLEIAYASEWKRLKLDEAIKRSIKLGAILGESYVVMNYDVYKIHGGTNAKVEGTPTLDVLPTTSVYIDPSATSFDDADFVVCRVRKTKEWVKRNKPEWFAKLKEKQNAEGGVSGNADSGELFKGHDYTTEQNNIYMLDQVYVKVVKELTTPIIEVVVDPITGMETPTIVGEETYKSHQVEIYYLIGDTLLESNTDYPFENFPIIQFAWEEMEQSPYCIPLMRGLTTPQKVVNLIESAMNNLAIHFTIPTTLVSDESGLDAERVAKLSGAAGVVYKVAGDPAKALTVVRPPSIDQALLVMKDSFIENIRNYAGVNAAYQGQIGTAGNTAGGVEIAVDRATMIDSLPLTQIEKFVEKITKLLIQYVCHYYKGNEYYTKDKNEQTGKYTFDSFTIEEDWEYLDFEYNIDLSIKTQNDKNRQYQTLLSLYQMQVQYKDPIKLVNVLDLVKLGELDNYNELFKRYKDMSEQTMQEKVDMVMELMQISMTPKPDGQPLIDKAILNDALIDIINDDGNLEYAQQIFDEYTQYQEQLKQVEGEIDAPQQETM